LPGVERVDELAPGFQSGDFINMKGSYRRFRGALQAIGQDIQKARPGEFQIKDLIRSAAGDIGELRDRLNAKVASVSDEWIRELLIKQSKTPWFQARFFVLPRQRVFIMRISAACSSISFQFWM